MRMNPDIPDQDTPGGGCAAIGSSRPHSEGGEGGEGGAFAIT
jgi:hypothetical protein